MIPVKGAGTKGMSLEVSILLIMASVITIRYRVVD